jgi:hypothetical protein
MGKLFETALGIGEIPDLEPVGAPLIFLERSRIRQKWIRVSLTNSKSRKLSGSEASYSYFFQ